MEKKNALNALYNSSSMTSAQEHAAESTLIDAEVNRIIFNGQPMSVREQELNQLYNASSMNSGEFHAAIERLHNTY